MELVQLRSFLVLMRVRNFRRAAAELHLSQPSLSQQIQRLEHELGVVLFDRRHRPVAATSAAETLATGAARILADLDSLAVQVRDTEGETRGTVRVATMQFLTLLELPAALVRFHSEQPQVELRLRTGTTADVRRMLVEGEADLGLLHAEGETLPPRIHRELLRRDELVVVTARHHDLATRGHAEWTELVDVPFVTFREGASLQEALSTAAAAAGFRPRASVESADLSAAIALVAAGVGVALVPRTLATTMRSQVATVTVGRRDLSRSLVLAWDESVYRSRASESFMEVARAAFRAAGP